MDLKASKTIALDNGLWKLIDPHLQESLDSCYQWEELPYDLPPMRRVLMLSQETVHIEEGMSGIICLRSTWARIGLIAPPTIADPGFHGTLTLEVFNANLSPVRIREGDSLWHMLIVHAPLEIPYDGKYQGQIALTVPKAI